VQAENLLHQQFVVSAGVLTNELLKLAAGVIVVAAPEHFAGGLEAQQGSLLVIDHAESRIKPGEVEMLPEDRRAESVDCVDLRALQQHKLAAEPAIGALALARLKRDLDARAHLAGGGARKSHNQKLIDIAGRLCVADEVSTTLGKDSGLARPRRRRHQQVRAARAYCATLLVRPPG